MINIEKVKKEVVKQLVPLDPDKIILFGSYAYGNPNEESDVDLLFVKDVKKEKVRDVRLDIRKKLRIFIAKNHIGIDIVVDSQQRIDDRIKSIKDQFFSEIMKKGQVIYAK